ncbi:hypothetical protein Tco_0431101 [Tanacetum coccineum]
MGSLAYADVEISLKVHGKCLNCKGKTLEILKSILGVYSVTWDTEEMLFRIAGEVDPNIIVKHLMASGEHAEIVRINVKHPHLRHQNHTSYAPSYGGGYVPSHGDVYNYGSYGGGYNMLPPSYRDAYLPYYGTNDQYHPYGTQRIAAPQIEYPSSYNNTLALQNPLPLATYVPSNPYQEPLNPYQEHDPYGNYHEGMTGCSIM